MKIPLPALLFALLSLSGLSAEDNPPAPNGDVDSLFTGEGGTADNDAQKNADKDTAPKAETPDIISELLPAGIKFGVDFRLLAGYSPGLNYLPGDVSDVSLIQYDDMALLDMNASLSINVRFSPDLKVVGRLSATLPAFTAEITDLYCDFDVSKTVYVRVGRNDIAWGISHNYAFANLLARLPTNPLPQTGNYKGADAIACRVSVPLGVGGVDLLAFTRSSLWTSPTQPAVDEIGFGAKFNLALPNFDFNIGGYYHKDLLPRLFYSLSTTLFGTIETYTEGAVSTNIMLPGVTWNNATWYFSGNLGFYFDVFGKALRINGEYFYCGEADDLTVKGAAFTLFPGHNVALNATLSLADGLWKIYLQGKYNISMNTGYVIPGIILAPIPHIEFTVSVPVTLGPTDGGYFTQNTANDNRRIALVFAAILKANL